MTGEIRTARNWYWWLWLSPLVTVPSFILITILSYALVNGLICRGRQYGCDDALVERVSFLSAVLGSALWHVVLLFPTLNKKSAFVRWHGAQMFLLAGVRTATPLMFGLWFGFELETLWFIPALLALWLFGALWGQAQAARGDCSLMRWFGRTESLPARRPAVKPAPADDLDVEALVDIIRYSRDPAERSQAVVKLEKLGLVESL